MAETVEKVITKAKKENVEATVMLSRAKVLSIEYEKDELSNTSDGYTNLLQIRVSKGKTFGYSLTDNLTNWENCFDKALKLMRVSKPLKREIVLSKPSKLSRVSGIYSKKLSDMPMEKVFEKADDAVREVKNVRKDVSLLMANFSVAENESIIGNTAGAFFSEKSTLMSSMIECGLGTANGTEGQDSRSDFDFVPIARDAARMCVDSIDPKSVKTMKTDLILDYFAASDLINATLVPSLNADNVQNNKSYLKGKIGKKVFSDKVSVSDDALMKGGLFSGRIDAEGSKTTKTDLISKGVVKNYLYDIYSSGIDKKKTTGNCSSISRVPSIGPTNFILKPGKYTRDQIINNTDKGILAKFVMGTHFVNPITGDASIGLCNAFTVEKGCIGHPIKQAMMFVNVFEALKSIEEIGTNMRQDSSIVCPTIKLKDVQIIT